MKINSIRLTLTLWYVLILSALILVSDFVLYSSFKKSLLDSIDDSLYTLAEEIEHSILMASPGSWQREITSVKDEFITNRFFVQVLEGKRGKNEKIQVHTRSGVLEGSIGSVNELFESLPSQPLYYNYNYKTVSIHPIRVIVFPVIKGGKHEYIIQVGTSLQKTFQSLDNLSVILIISGPILLILTSLGGYIILTKAINPVKSVVQTARRISTDDLSLRIDAKGKSQEISELIDTFNDMISRLEKSVKKIKQFSSDVSHELRTPLTVIRGEIEIAMRKERKKEDYKNILGSIVEESKRMEAIIENLLFLAELDYREKTYAFSSVPLFEVLLENIEALRNQCTQKGITLQVGNLDALYVNGNRSLLERLVSNLTNNALKYTDPGGIIKLSLLKKEEQALLEVQDSGIGISAASLPYVFDRFYRVDNARTSTRPGCGLGLSIVKQVVDLHGGSIDMTSQPGEGTTVRVNFPLF